MSNSNKELELMKQISNGQYHSDSVNELTIKEKTNNQFKLFLLAQAKRELNRVVKYMNLLDKVEKGYSDKVEDMIDNGEMTLAGFGSAMNLIYSSLSRSNDIIKSVIKDESLNNIVIIDNSTNISNNSNNVIGSKDSLGLSDPDSRDRVSKVVSNMLNIIENKHNEIELIDKESSDTNE